jgi:predicted nicotinamide N-methyase
MADSDEPSQLERSLHLRFTTREEVFEHRDTLVKLLMPRSAEELLDEEAFERDERMPYWADLWPSAKALSRWILDQPADFFRQRFIELGCGVGLPSLAVLKRCGDVMATDHNDDALLFAQCNAARNSLPPLRAQLLDWRDDAPGLAPFGVALAADVLYERRNSASLSHVLPRCLMPRGTLILADPGRAHLPLFKAEMSAAGWETAELETRREMQKTANGEAASEIQIIRFTRRT